MSEPDAEWKRRALEDPLVVETLQLFGGNIKEEIVEGHPGADYEDLPTITRISKANPDDLKSLALLCWYIDPSSYPGTEPTDPDGVGEVDEKVKFEEFPWVKFEQSTRLAQRILQTLFEQRAVYFRDFHELSELLAATPTGDVISYQLSSVGLQALHENPKELMLPLEGFEAKPIPFYRQYKAVRAVLDAVTRLIDDLKAGRGSLIRCENCKCVVPASRSFQRFCSSVCRTRASARRSYQRSKKNNPDQSDSYGEI